MCTQKDQAKLRHKQSLRIKTLMVQLHIPHNDSFCHAICVDAASPTPVHATLVLQCLPESALDRM